MHDVTVQSVMLELGQGQWVSEWVTHSGCGAAGMCGVVWAAREVRRFAHGAGWAFVLLGRWGFGRWSGTDEGKTRGGTSQTNLIWRFWVIYSMYCMLSTTTDNTLLKSFYSKETQNGSKTEKQ